MSNIDYIQIDFDSESCAIRVSGTNVAENKFIKMGQYHTVDLELNRAMTLKKDQWDFVSLERIESVKASEGESQGVSE